MTNRNLAALVPLVQAGDSEAFSALYHATYPSAYYHAKTILNNEQDIEDSLQEAYTTVYTRIGNLREPEAVSAWIAQIVTYTCLHKRRGGKTNASFSLDDEEFTYEPVADDSSSPEALLDKWGTAEILGRIIEQLPEAQRLTVTMFYYDELRVSDIAAALGCSENTVKSRLNYARRNIEKAVREEEKRGVKLYSVSPAMLLAALRRTVKTMPSAPELPPVVPPAPTQATASGSAAAAKGNTARRSASAAARSAGAKHAAAKATRRAAVHGAKAAAVKGITAKVISGIAAAAILTGGVGLGVAIRTGALSPEPAITPTSVVEQVIPSTQEEVEQDNTEAISTETLDGASMDGAEKHTIEVTITPNASVLRSIQPRALYVNYAETHHFKENDIFRLIDLNGDGVDELLVIREDSSNNVAFLYAELYTIHDGKVIQLRGKGTQVIGGAGARAVLLNHQGAQMLALEAVSGELSLWTHEALVCSTASLDDWQEVTLLSHQDDHFREYYEDGYYSNDGYVDVRSWNQAFSAAETLLDSRQITEAPGQLRFSEFMQLGADELAASDFLPGRWGEGSRFDWGYDRELVIESLTERELVFTYTPYRLIGMNAVHASIDPQSKTASFSYSETVSATNTYEAEGRLWISEAGLLVMQIDRSTIPYLDSGTTIEFFYAPEESFGTVLSGAGCLVEFRVDGFCISFQAPSSYQLTEPQSWKTDCDIVGDDNSSMLVYVPLSTIDDTVIQRIIENDQYAVGEDGTAWRTLTAPVSQKAWKNGETMYRMDCIAQNGAYQILGYYTYNGSLFRFFYNSSTSYYEYNRDQIENMMSSFDIVKE